jgi:GntR family transcriptional regulator
MKSDDDTGPDVTRERLPRLKVESLTSQARDVLVESFRNGGFGGLKLPPEGELAAQLGVSRATLRGALRSLEDQGLITRRRGIGTLINSHAARSSVSLSRVVGFHQLIRESGYQSEMAWTRVTEAPASAELAARVNCSEGAPIFRVERLLLADAVPAIHIVEHIPHDEVTRAFTADEFPNSIFEFADDYCRYRIDQTILEIGAMTAQDELATILSVPEGAALLELVELHYCGSVPRMFSNIYAVPPFIRFSVVRTRS